MKNIGLMKRVLDQIETHPETHDQSRWVNTCRTMACVAGWASILSGDEIIPNYVDGDYRVWVDRRFVEISDRARQLLGLSEDEATDLFFSSEEDAVRLLKKWIADGS